jgi:hypothetical protein
VRGWTQIRGKPGSNRAREIWRQWRWERQNPLDRAWETARDRDQWFADDRARHGTAPISGRDTQGNYIYRTTRGTLASQRALSREHLRSVTDSIRAGHIRPGPDGTVRPARLHGQRLTIIQGRSR